MPLWNNRKQLPLVAAAEAERRAARLELESAGAEVRAEAARLLAEWQNATAQIERYQTAILPLNSAALDAARASYLGGRGDFSAVVDEFRRWIDVRIELAGRESDRFSAQARLAALARAAGGSGYAVDPGQEWCMNVSSVFRQRGHPGRLAVAALLIALVAVVAIVSCAAKPASQQLYNCPMHPDYVSDQPGNCPICGMKLVPMKAPAPGRRSPTAVQPADHQHGQAEPAPAEKDVYVCPMHPQVRQDKPGKCPICGMDLVKEVKPPEPAPKGPASQSTAPPAPGLAPVHTEPGRAQLAGVRTVAAVTDSVTSTVRAVGTVVPDETRIRDVTTKVAGWVEKLYVNAVGQFVRAGQPLLELYSPELVASQEEDPRARQNAAEFARSSLPEVRRGGEDLARAARRRLELFDVPAEFLRRLEETGTAQRTITFPAPFSGYVTEKTVFEGQKVEPGMALLTVADLSRVWVAGQLYEAEAAAAKVGRRATVTLPYEPDVALHGQVTARLPDD